MHGSKLTYIFASFKLYLHDFIALNSACGLPFIPVWPKEMTLSFLTMTHPTDGFSPVKPDLSLAKLKARFIKKRSL